LQDLRFGNEVLLGPYRRRDLMFELMILGFVLREIHLDPQVGIKMQKKTCVFLHLTSTSY